MMKPQLYKLFAIQSFNQEIVAVYVNIGEFPEPEILTDSLEIARNYITYKELKKSKPWKYTEKFINGVDSEKLIYNIRNLRKYSKIFNRSIKIIENNNNVDKAIFVDTIYQVDWHGEQDLYLNKNFSIYKSSFPNYSSCEFLRKINL